MLYMGGGGGGGRGGEGGGHASKLYAWNCHGTRATC